MSTGSLLRLATTRTLKSSGAKFSLMIVAISKLSRTRLAPTSPVSLLAATFRIPSFDKPSPQPERAAWLRWKLKSGSSTDHGGPDLYTRRSAGLDSPASIHSRGNQPGVEADQGASSGNSKGS